MKKNQYLILTLCLISGLTLGGCKNKNEVSREQALKLLNQITSSYQGYALDDDYFIVGEKLNHSITTSKNDYKSTFESTTNEISHSGTTSSSSTSEDTTTLYRYSKEKQYASYLIKTSDNQTRNVIFNVYQFSTDEHPYLYVYDYVNDENGVNITKNYLRIADDYDAYFNEFVSFIKSKAITLIDQYSTSKNAYNYFSSLPSKLSSGNKENYLSLNEQSVYLRASGNDGTSIAKEMGLEGTQDLYLVRFSDGIATSSYISSNNNTSKTASDKFTLGGGMLTYYPLVAGSLKATYTDANNSTHILSDDGEGRFVEDDKVLSSSFINYSTGEFLVDSVSGVTLNISYSYEISNVTYYEYGAQFTSFTPTDAFSNPTTSTSYTLVDAIDYQF